MRGSSGLDVPGDGTFDLDDLEAKRREDQQRSGGGGTLKTAFGPVSPLGGSVDFMLTLRQ
jgi:hypothetical protein